MRSKSRACSKWVPETSVGRDFNQDVLNSLLELDWSTPDRKFSAYAQAIYLGQRGPKGWDEDVIARVGALWTVDERWSFEGQYSQDIKTYGTRPEAPVPLAGETVTPSSAVISYCSGGASLFQCTRYSGSK